MVRWIKGDALDRAWLVEPDAHIYVRSKRSFVEISDGKPQFEGHYEKSKVWRQESLDRWAKLLPEIEKYRESGGNEK